MLAGRQFQAFGAERQQTELLRCFRDVLQSELASIGRLVLVDRRAIHRRSASAADRDLRSVQHKCRYWRNCLVLALGGNDLFLTQSGPTPPPGG